MIVSDDTVSKALAYLAEDPHPLAEAQAGLMLAEKRRDELFAQLYLDTEGTAKERESRVMIHPAFKNCRDEEISANREVSRHRQRTKAADKILDIYQTQSANVRKAERIR